MIKRTNREAMYNLLEQHPEWNIVDLASSNAGWKYADVYTDVTDYSEYYKDKYNNEKKFFQCNVEKTPFKDKEFDFVVASHILEHVENPEKFCDEMMRISKRGYIEVPTPLWDNLVDGPHFSKYGHKWWVTFDDDKQSIIINRKINVVDKFLSIKEHNLHMAWFRDSIITQLYWEDKIPIERGDGIYKYNDNRDINFKFDSNTIQDWNHKTLFSFGNYR